MVAVFSNSNVTMLNVSIVAIQQPDEEEAAAEVDPEADPDEKMNAKKEERKQRKLKRKMAANGLFEPMSQKKTKTTSGEMSAVDPEPEKPEISPKPKEGKKKANRVAKTSEKVKSPAVNGGSTGNVGSPKKAKKIKKSKTG